jgi:histidine phosphotransferase ChpT
VLAVCHDLISPVGAIMNGLEVMEEGKDEETAKFAMDLIKKSAGRPRPSCSSAGWPSARRLGRRPDRHRRRREGDARADGGREDQDRWNLPRVLLAKNRVKLLLNMMLLGAQAIPRGGQLTVDPVGTAKTAAFRLLRPAPTPRCRSRFRPAGRATRPTIRVDAHAIQPFYTGLARQKLAAERRHGDGGDARGDGGLSTSGLVRTRINRLLTETGRIASLQLEIKRLPTHCRARGIRPGGRVSRAKAVAMDDLLKDS